MKPSISPEINILLERVASGLELTPEEHLKLSLTRPLPTFFEESLLRWAYVTRFGDVESPVRHWHLHFLRDLLSSAIFSDLVTPLNDLDTAVTYGDIRRLYQRKHRLMRLKNEVRELQKRRSLVIAQKQFAKK